NVVPRPSSRDSRAVRSARECADLLSTTPGRQEGCHGSTETPARAQEHQMSESFAELLEQSINQEALRPGALLNATVVDIRGDVVIVNAGLKSEGVIPIEQFQNEAGDIDVKVGDEVEVALDAVEDGFGETRLSREKAVRARSWTRLEKAFEAGEIVSGFISG